jgi:cytochrome oxidase Cu insertion factor (SCO1/SenC/PrrC family)
MKKILIGISLVCMFAIAAFPQAAHLKVGMPAPDFTLNDTAGKPIKLSDFKGKKSVVLAFYVLAFTGG